MKIKKLLILFMGAVILTFSSCEEEEIIPTPPDTDDFYLVAKIDGRSKHLVQGRNGFRLRVETDIEDSTTDPEIKKYKYKSGVAQLDSDYYIKSTEAAFVYFDNNWFNEIDYAADFELFSTVFTEGSRIFCNNTDEVTPCVEIYWKDTYSKEWTTRNGTQESALFDITSITESVGSGGQSQRMVKATFNCTLYSDLGDRLELKNGQLFLVFRRA